MTFRTSGIPHPLSIGTGQFLFFCQNLRSIGFLVEVKASIVKCRREREQMIRNCSLVKQARETYLLRHSPTRVPRKSELWTNRLDFGAPIDFGSSKVLPVEQSNLALICFMIY